MKWRPHNDKKCQKLWMTHWESFKLQGGVYPLYAYYSHPSFQ